jgi:hypothetical protein
MVVNSYACCCIRTCAFHSVGNYPTCWNRDHLRSIVIPVLLFPIMIRLMMGPFYLWTDADYRVDQGE